VIHLCLIHGLGQGQGQGQRIGIGLSLVLVHGHGNVHVQSQLHGHGYGHGLGFGHGQGHLQGLYVEVNFLTTKIGVCKMQIELNDLVSLLKSNEKKEVPFEVGKKYFLRCVTYHSIGTVKAIVGDFLILKDAVWVADSGRLNPALKTGEVNEMEDYINDTIVAIGSIVDATEWSHDKVKAKNA
jgi:hypothetical protein